MKKDFLTLHDMSADEIQTLIKRAVALKKEESNSKPLAGKVLGLVFEKESTRTRISFEVGMIKLGGQAIYLGQNASQLSRGESYADTARVLSRYVNGLVLRTFSQASLEEMASYSDIPVINGLTDMYHPCQLLADLVTVYEKKANLQQVKICYIGDGNNMAHSWMVAASLLGLQLNVSCPQGFEPHPDVVKKIKQSSSIQLIDDPSAAIADCDVVNTDTWFSMGQEVSDEKRELFARYQINQELLNKANKDAIVLHCLPAHRGEEITDEVIDGPQSVVFDQAENRLYAQMALLEMLMK